MSDRIKWIQKFFIIWALVIGLRLVYWQVVKAQELKTQADYQHQNEIELPANRGLILFSDGSPMVANKENYLLFVEPKKLPKDLSSIVSTLITETGTDSAVANLKTAAASDLNWHPVTRNVSSRLKNTLENLKVSGLGFEPSPVRGYPEGSMSAYISGFVGKNDRSQAQGYFGVEGFYDRQLSGVPGKLIEQKDGLGNPIPISDSTKIPTYQGRTLTTSIDRTVQFVAYQKLKDGVEKFQATSGTVTILETKTGNVLGMVSYPGYDPENYANFDEQLYRNPMVSDSYEPGSTFKTIVMASAFDANVVSPDTHCTECSRPLVIDGQTVRNYDDKYMPDANMWDIILHSDNVGMVYVGHKLGKDRLLDYFKKFGLGKLTGIDMQEESSPEIRPNNQWHEIDWSTACFGQGIAVTPLQLTTAVNAIANGGKLVSPSIVSSIDGQAVGNKKTSQAISPVAARKMVDLMVNGVDNGQVKIHKPAGYQVAGKTGTAQVPIEGHYDKDKTIASFVAFAPAYDPKFTMLVTIREPKATPWGSTTAAPVWFDIAKELLRYYRIPPQYN